jgi:hypothetical protein
MKKMELIKTNKGFDYVVDESRVVSMSKNEAVNSFEIFNSFTEDSISCIKKITFRKKNDN